MKINKKKFHSISEVKNMISRLKTSALRKSLTLASRPADTVNRLKKVIKLSNSLCIVFLQYGKVN